jgi:hypothetical protein
MPFMLNVIAECRYAECHYAECHGAIFRTHDFVFSQNTVISQTIDHRVRVLSEVAKNIQVTIYKTFGFYILLAFTTNIRLGW